MIWMCSDKPPFLFSLSLSSTNLIVENDDTYALIKLFVQNNQSEYEKLLISSRGFDLAWTFSNSCKFGYAPVSFILNKHSLSLIFYLTSRIKLPLRKSSDFFPITRNSFNETSSSSNMGPTSHNDQIKNSIT